MAQLKPHQTPDSYSSTECVKDLGHGVKVVENSIFPRENYFHVIREPHISQISEPSDIEVVSAFQVGRHETREEVLEEAIAAAEETSPHPSQLD